MFWYIVSFVIFAILTVMVVRDHMKADKAKQALARKNEERSARWEEQCEREADTAETERLAQMKEMIRDVVATQLELQDNRIRQIVWEEARSKPKP